MRARAAVALGAGVVVGAAAAAVLALRSPRVGARVVRVVLDRDAVRRGSAQRPFDPGDVAVLTERYRDEDPAALVDVHVPQGATGPLPTVVWVHGGAGVAGSRTDDSTYFSVLAHEGFAVAALDYRLAPEHPYPAALEDVQDALAFLLRNADRLHVDASRIVLAGDSAGAQIASQVAVLTTSSRYADLLGLAPALPRAALRGVVLCCGYVDLPTFAERGAGSSVPLLRWGVTIVLRAYAGASDPASPVLREMSAREHVTEDFPPTFVTGGNGDPLTDTQSRPFASQLAGLGVAVTPVFFPPDHEVELGHLYHVDLASADAQATLRRLVAFLRSVT